MMQAPAETLERFARGQSDATERSIVEAHLRLCGASESLVRTAVEGDPELAEWESLAGAAGAEEEGASGASAGAAPQTLLKKIKTVRQAGGGGDTRIAFPPGAGVHRDQGIALPQSARGAAGRMPSGNGRASESEVPLPEEIMMDLRPQPEWQWLSLWPCRGRVALVKTDPVTGTALYCGRFKPGSRFPRHGHGVREEVLVLTGAYRYDDVEVCAGDYDVKEPGTEHAPRVLPGEDCWVLIRQGAPRSPVFTGSSIWRRPLVRLMRLAGKPGV